MTYFLFQFEYLTAQNVTQTYGPVFHKEEFLKPALRLQQAIENITTENGITMGDVCNAPLAPQVIFY